MLTQSLIYYRVAMNILKTVTSENWTLNPVKHVALKLGFNNYYLLSISL